MRQAPTTDSDRKDLEELRAEPWMIELLNLNPGYCCWGPNEDYMWKEGKGWDSQVLFESWEKFGPWTLDDMNECVNFHFEIDRDSVPCETCGESGYHVDALWVSDSFYRHSSPFTLETTREVQSKAVLHGFGSRFPEPLGRGTYPSDAVLERYGRPFREFCDVMRDGEGCWEKALTDDEWQALKDAGRTPLGSLGHDGINRHILIKRRLERLGLPETCEACDGHGYVHTTELAHVNLILWWLHPRKGCSRGVQVRITQGDVPAALSLLREAAKRNAERFEKICEGEAESG